MNISEMTNEELNEALAVEVMGWGMENGFFVSPTLKDGKEIVCFVWEWTPTEDMNQAVECLNYWLNVTGSLVEIKKMDNKYWEVELWRESPKTAPENPLNGVATDESFPRALSEAVLMAKRGEK